VTTATEEFKTNLVRAADDGGYRVRTQLAMAKQQMAVRDEPAPRGSLAARTARPHHQGLTPSRRPANALVVVQPGTDIKTSLNALKKQMVTSAVWALVGKRNFRLYSAASPGARRRAKAARPGPRQEGRAAPARSEGR